MADKESGFSEQPPLGGVSDPQGRRTASLPPSLSPSRSPGHAGPSSLLPLPPPTPGRCAWQPPGRISWHWSENKQHSAPVIPLPRRPLRGRRGRVGGVSGRGLPAAFTLGWAAAAAAAARAREMPPARLRAYILRIAPSGLPRCPGSDSSWQRQASRATRPPARSPGGRRIRRGRDAAREGAPGTGFFPPRLRSSRSALGHIVPHPAGFCLCLDSLCGYLTLPSLSLSLPGTPAAPLPNILRLGHTCLLTFHLQLPCLWPPSFPPPEQASEFPFLALTHQEACPKTAPPGRG